MNNSEICLSALAEDYEGGKYDFIDCWYCQQKNGFLCNEDNCEQYYDYKESLKNEYCEV